MVGIGSARPWQRVGLRRVREGAILVEDRDLQGTQFRSRLEPELAAEVFAGSPVRRERVGLASSTVQREHQLPAQPLTQGLLAHERLELADQSGIHTEREFGIDPILDGGQARVLKPRDLSLGERLVGEVRQRGAAP